MADTKIVRVSKEAHDTLRFLAYKQNKPITTIVDELLEGKGPTIAEKLRIELNQS